LSLKPAAQTPGPLASRARLHQGYIDGAPQGPFDAATCLLTLHFMALEERRRAAIEVHRRLKPGAPHVIAHLSFAQDEGERAL
jgi:tRNA (cmo5U34)-methyltransferase